MNFCTGIHYIIVDKITQGNFKNRTHFCFYEMLFIAYDVINSIKLKKIKIKFKKSRCHKITVYYYLPDIDAYLCKKLYTYDALCSYKMRSKKSNMAAVYPGFHGNASHLSRRN